MRNEKPVQENYRKMQEGAVGTLMETLGIEVVEMTAFRVRARMPVTSKVHQPYGLLHGGASVALAETVASIGANLNCSDDHMAVGLEINANHIRARRDGDVMAEALPLHVGRSTQVWEVRIVDETEKLVCISRCTLAVVPKP